MKSKYKTWGSIFLFVLTFQVNAQLSMTNEDAFFKMTKSNADSIELKQVVHILDTFHLILIPQFDGLFTKILNKRIEGINTKNYFQDFDLGFNLGFNYKLKDSINLDFLYNVGLMKFSVNNPGLIQAPHMKLAISYVF
ncbi:MAG: hypothetical protein KC469_13370 [Flavobacteriaceae bacterium]|nr:hypothetical protein [Flavobacteriaceae bacterium]